MEDPCSVAGNFEMLGLFQLKLGQKAISAVNAVAMDATHTFACLWTLMMPQMVCNAHIVSKLRKVWICKGCLFMATCLQRLQRANLENLQHPTNRVSIDFRLSHSLVILRLLCFQWAMAFLQLCCLSIPSIGTLQSSAHMHRVLHHFKDSNDSKFCWELCWFMSCTTRSTDSLGASLAKSVWCWH